MFMATDDFLLPNRLIESEDKRKRQRIFRTRVNGEATRDVFTSPEDLAQKVIRAIFNMKLMSASVESIVGFKAAIKADNGNPLLIPRTTFKNIRTSEPDRASKDNEDKIIEVAPKLKSKDKSDGAKLCKQDVEELKRFQKKLKECWETKEPKK